MQLPLVLAFALFSLAHAASLPLLDALRTLANATKFAQYLEDNPALLALYNTSTTKTIFAPSDAYFGSAIGGLRRRQSSDPQQQLEYQYTNQLTNLATLGPTTAPGAVVNSGLASPGLGGKPQAIVTNKITQLTNRTTPLRRRQSSNGTVPLQGIQLFSGLGNNVTLVQGDIPFDCGLIHSVSGFFTLPSALSTTLNSTGLSSLGSFLGKANLTSKFDAAQSVTIFTPNDAAFAAAANSTGNPSTLGSLLNNHVIPGFVGYLPDLVNGATYTSSAGETLKVTVTNGVYYINGAKIVSSNTIISNGVAHVIDKVLVPTKAPVFKGAASSLGGSNTIVTAVSIALFAVLMV